MRTALAAIAATLITAGTAHAEVSPGCVKPYSAMEIGQTLARQRVGAGYHALPAKELPNEEMTAAQSGDRRIVLMAFGCRGDYVDELQQEDKEIANGEHRPIRFVNDTAMVIAIFTKPPTARESAVVQLTLDAL